MAYFFVILILYLTNQSCCSGWHFADICMSIFRLYLWLGLLSTFDDVFKFSEVSAVFAAELTIEHPYCELQRWLLPPEGCRIIVSHLVLKLFKRWFLKCWDSLLKSDTSELKRRWRSFSCSERPNVGWRVWRLIIQYLLANWPASGALLLSNLFLLLVSWLDRW